MCVSVCILGTGCFHCSCWEVVRINCRVSWKKYDPEDNKDRNREGTPVIFFFWIL